MVGEGHYHAAGIDETMAALRDQRDDLGDAATVRLNLLNDSLVRCPREAR